jgi:hypothetical protein
MHECDFEFKYVQGKVNGAADALSRKETKQIQPTQPRIFTNGQMESHFTIIDD